MPLKPADRLTAKVTEWDRAKGYGYLQIGAKRLFLHRRDFIRTRREPRVGEAITFSVGADAKGRTCAQNAIFADGRTWSGSSSGWLVMRVLAAGVLLILPVTAAWRQGIQPHWITGYVLGVSLLTYWQYACDKHRALEGLWRVSEARLHLLELIGGWPGAIIAQCSLRHKITKRSYLFVFWMIVALYQVAALDSMKQWRWSHAALNQIERFSEEGNRLLRHATFSKR